MKVPEALTRKVGPLPVGLWIVGIGGGLAVGAYLRRARANSGAVSELDQGSSGATEGIGSTTGGLATSGTGGAAYSDPAIISTGSSAVDAGSDSGLSEPFEYANNAQWRRAAVRAGIGFGHTAIYCENAVAKYLTGKGLSYSEGVMINQVVAQIGPTPAPVPHSTVARAPTVPLNNSEWSTAGAHYLHTRYGYNESLAREALIRYVNGDTLTTKQAAMKDRAIAGKGAPPNPVKIKPPHIVAHPISRRHTTNAAPAVTTRDGGR